MRTKNSENIFLNSISMRGSKNPRDDFADSFSFPSKSRFEGAKFNLYSSTSIFLSEPTCQNKNIYMDFGNHTGNRQWMMNCSCLFIFLLVLSDRVRNLKGKSVISWAVRARIFCWTFNPLRSGGRISAHDISQLYGYAYELKMNTIDWILIGIRSISSSKYSKHILFWHNSF